MAPGPLLAACGFHYQEFTNLPGPKPLTPDPYEVGEQNLGAVWEEFLVPDTAETVASFDDPYWHFPAITRNKYGSGTLTYEGTFVTDTLQREVIRDVLKRAGLTGPDQDLPGAIRVRHGRNGQGKVLHYYLNFSGQEQSISYPYNTGLDLLTAATVQPGQALTVKPWDLAIVSEQ
jgi:beta-galactosidase